MDILHLEWVNGELTNKILAWKFSIVWEMVQGMAKEWLGDWLREWFQE